MVLRRPDFKHEEHVRSLARFMDREDGDTGTLLSDEGSETVFEVARREVLEMPGAQLMVRLTCRNVDTEEEFNLDANKVHTYKIIWD